MSYRVRVGDDFPMGGVAVWIGNDDTRPRLAYRITASHLEIAAQRPEGSAVEPAFVLPDEVALMLLDALASHYQGAADVRTVRADLLAERARVDKLTDVVIELGGVAVQRLAAGRRDPWETS
jgi:hypothetical protein